ncbi:hypothetical protein [Cerasicoccus maritimus]|uniref:hypothetical protein n=1 Tax=Cerasicoccus maritimus TaxID=490089 RepID=UPI0028526D35|nr:hypothetical protein [Cerasicoccus maritimus]
MTAFRRQRIRLKIDLGNPFADLSDLLATGSDSTPQIARGMDLQFEGGAFHGDTLLDVSVYSSITLEVKLPRAGRYAPDEADAPLLKLVVANADLNAALTSEEWDAGAEDDAHVVFAFTGAQTKNVSAGNRWLAIYATTNDDPGRTVPLAAGLVTFAEEGVPSVGDAPEPAVEYYDKETSDARYVQKAPADANLRVKNGKAFQLVDPDTGLWHDLFVYTNNGTEPARLHIADVGEA